MIYVVTGLPRSGTSYLVRCLQNGGCRVVRHRRHKRLELGNKYRLKDFKKIIKKVNHRNYNPRVNYVVKVFAKHLPLIKYEKNVCPILIVRDYETLKASAFKRDLGVVWVRMGKPYLEEFYDIYYRWLKERWPNTEKIIFPHFDKWVKETKSPARIIPYVRRRDG